MPCDWAVPPFVLVPDAGPVAAPFRQLMAECTAVRAFRSQLLVSSVDALLLMVARLVTSKGGGTSLIARHPAVLRAQELLDLHPGEPWSTAQLARMAGLSSSHLASRFSQELGVTIHRYLVERRLTGAHELIRSSDTPITAIASHFGFSSSQHLATAYKKRYGVAPMDTRRSAHHAGSKQCRPETPKPRKR